MSGPYCDVMWLHIPLTPYACILYIDKKTHFFFILPFSHHFPFSVITFHSQSSLFILSHHLSLSVIIFHKVSVKSWFFNQLFRERILWIFSRPANNARNHLSVQIGSAGYRSKEESTWSSVASLSSSSSSSSSSSRRQSEELELFGCTSHKCYSSRWSWRTSRICRLERAHIAACWSTLQ